MSRSSHKLRRDMLLLEVMLSLVIVSILVVILMGHLGYVFARNQKERALFAYETEVQLLDLTVLGLIEELAVQLVDAPEGILPLYIDDREGRKVLCFHINHPQDPDKLFEGVLKCTLSIQQGAVLFTQENEKLKKRETGLFKTTEIKFELFDPETKIWMDHWPKEKRMLPPLLRVTIPKAQKEKNNFETLYYLTPFLNTPLPL